MATAIHKRPLESKDRSEQNDGNVFLWGGSLVRLKKPGVSQLTVRATTQIV